MADQLGRLSLRMRLRRLGWFYVIGVTLVLTCLVTLAGLGAPDAPSFSVLHSRQQTTWLVWFLLAPSVVRLSRLYPLAAETLRYWILRHVAIGLVFALAAHALASLVVLVTSRGHQAGPGDGPPFIAAVAWGLLIYALIATTTQAISYHERVAEQEAAAERLRADLAEARLAAIQGKLQPHFLFNALNSVAALVRTNAVEAERVVEQLSELLRTTLRANPLHEVPLESAMQLVQSYLAIEQVRYGGRLRTRIDMPAEAYGCLVPQMLLQPIVENAVRHGIAPMEQGGQITITATVEADVMRLVIEDDGAGLVMTERASTGTGLGVGAARSALVHLYGNEQSLEMRPREPHGTRVTITLPCRRVGS